MSKTFYAPVSGLSKQIKKFYAPVGSLSKAVTKAYCSVGGLSKQFWGSGDSLIFEYDYQDNTIYSIHNYLTLEYVLTACYNEFIRRYSSQDAELIYLINNWQTIKSAIITTAENTGYNIQNIRVSINHPTSASVPHVEITVWYGDDAFPKNVKTGNYCKSIDSFGNIRYYLLPPSQASSTPPPQGDYWFTTNVFSSYYNVNTPRAATVNMDYIGLYNNPGYRETTMSNFGMKIQNT